MKKTLIVLLGLSLVAAPSITSAQQGQGKGPRRGQGPGQGQGQGLQQRRGPQAFPPPVALLFDVKEKDGVISNQEIALAPSLLLALDANEDGVVSGDELCVRAAVGEDPCPAGQGAQAGKRRGAKQDTATPSKGMALLALFDADKDGALSTDEINGSDEVLTSLDANKDLQLTPDEIRPRAGCVPGQGRGAGRRGPGPGACTGDCPFQK